MNPDEITVGIFHPLSLKFYGGGEVSIINISKGLEQMGIKNVIYEDESYTGPERVDDAYLKHAGINLQRVKMSSPSKLHSFLFQPMPSPEMLDKHTIVMIMLRRVPSRYDMRNSNRSNSKKIFLLHGIGLERIRFSDPVVMAYQLYMRLQLFIIRRLLINGQNYFQVLNPFQRGFLIKMGVPAERIFLIETGMKSDEYAVMRNDSNFQVLFIGRIENLQKGIKRLLKVAKLTRRKREDIVFKIIGSGSYRLRGRELSLVSHLGFVPEERKISELAGSNLLIVTSNIETYGLSLIEGLFSGLPVVTTLVSGPSGILRHSQGFGAVSSFSPKRLSEDVLKYYDEWGNNKQRYFDEKVERSKKARELFNLENMVDMYTGMIKDILGRSVFPKPII
jgi:glycosyltransferase involved in cell wall biosynthesis